MAIPAASPRANRPPTEDTAATRDDRGRTHSPTPSSTGTAASGKIKLLVYVLCPQCGHWVDRLPLLRSGSNLMESIECARCRFRPRDVGESSAHPSPALRTTIQIPDGPIHVESLNPESHADDDELAIPGGTDRPRGASRAGGEAASMVQVPAMHEERAGPTPRTEPSSPGRLTEHERPAGGGQRPRRSPAGVIVGALRRAVRAVLRHTDYEFRRRQSRPGGPAHDQHVGSSDRLAEPLGLPSPSSQPGYANGSADEDRDQPVQDRIEGGGNATDGTRRTSADNASSADGLARAVKDDAEAARAGHGPAQPRNSEAGEEGRSACACDPCNCVGTSLSGPRSSMCMSNIARSDPYVPGTRTAAPETSAGPSGHQANTSRPRRTLTLQFMGASFGSTAMSRHSSSAPESFPDDPGSEGSSLDLEPLRL
ncbi:MAG: hypothetical protein M1832_003725 [Thelocarpon impressellum]|nr:MAG: hypothetical protein M1832_003725 [Thelocarpon impressellum]